MYYFYNQQDIEKFNYKKRLKKDINKAGGFLLAMFGAMFIFTFIILLFTSVNYLSYNSNIDIMSDDSYLLLINGLVSLLSFFAIGYIYCKIAGIKFVEILTFEKNKISILIPLCLMGLAIAMASNYASDAVMGLFDFLGYDVSIDMDYATYSIKDIIIYYVSVAVVPACVEEFAFRGIVLGVLRKHSDSLAIIVSSIMFGLMHGNFMQIPFAFVVGLILGFVVVKTNSLLPGIIIHFLNNAISVTFSLLSSSQNIPMALIDLIYISIMLVIITSGIISTIFLIKKHKGFFKLSGASTIIPFKEKVQIFCESPTMIVFAILMLLESFSAITMGI